jgi:hypothetical protein
VPFRLTGKISKFPRFNLRKASKDILRRNIRLRRNSVENGSRNRRRVARAT